MTLELTLYNNEFVYRENVIAFDFDGEAGIIKIIYDNDSEFENITRFVKRVRTI